jgi:microcystin-dependent protein
MEGTIGEIRGFAGDFAPKNWNFCDGSILQIRSNTALFSLLGTVYGGDGRMTFGLPDLRGRVPIGQGDGTDLTPRTLGEILGQETQAVTSTYMPAHMHLATLSSAPLSGAVVPRCQNDIGSEASPTGHVMASINGGYASPGDAGSTMAPMPVTLDVTNIGVTVQNAGASQPIKLFQPSLAINWIICMYGVFPPRY